MTQHVLVYWTCPNCGEGGEEHVIHTHCGGALYRDPDNDIVYCCVCGEKITYFQCYNCGYEIYIDED